MTAPSCVCEAKVSPPPRVESIGDLYVTLKVARSAPLAHGGSDVGQQPSSIENDDFEDIKLAAYGGDAMSQAFLAACRT